MLRFLSPSSSSLSPLRRHLSSMERVINIGSLVTPSATGATVDTYHNCELRIHAGKVVEIVTDPTGTSTGVSERVSERVVDARGGLVTPGFIDAHTHLMPPTDRANEFAMR
jgi:imidazolonepropionase